jgi:hypothetical protein
MRCFLLIIFVLLFALPLAAQVMDTDSKNNDADVDFTDVDSLHAYSFRVGAGYNGLPNDRFGNGSVVRAFRRKLGNPVQLDLNNSYGDGIGISLEGFRKLNQFFSAGVGLHYAPIIRFANPTQTTGLNSGDTTRVARNAFYQAFYLEALVEGRFKLMLLKAGLGVNMQRIGDDLTPLIVTPLNQIQELPSTSRSAFYFSPYLIFGFGIDIFFSSRYALVPTYRHVFWQEDGQGASSYTLALVFRMGL